MNLRIALKHLLSRPLSTVLTILAVAGGLSILGGFWMVVENLDRVRSVRSTRPVAEAGLTVFLDSKLAAAEVDGLKAKLSADERFSSVTVVAPDQALRSLEAQFGEALTKIFEGSELPVTLKLVFRDSSLRRDDFITLQNQIRGLPGVLDVDDGTGLLPGEASALPKRIVSWATALLVFVFAGVALLVSHLIRLAFESLRGEIETMKVLGASPFWIIRPLLAEGFILGLTGSLLALGLVYLGVEVALPNFASFLLPKDVTIEALSASSALQLIGLGLVAALLGALGTWPLVARPPQVK